MIAFIDDHRRAHGVEPICKVLPIGSSTYHDHVAKRAVPEKLSSPVGTKWVHTLRRRTFFNLPR